MRNLCVAVGRGQVLERAAMGWALLGMLKEPWLVGLFAFLGEGDLCSNGKGLWQGWWLLLCWGWHTGPQERVPACLRAASGHGHPTRLQHRWLPATRLNPTGERGEAGGGRELCSSRRWSRYLLAPVINGTGPMRAGGAVAVTKCSGPAGLWQPRNKG